MKKITPTELKEWIKTDKSLVLIDIREPWEHELYNIGGLLLPIGDLMQRRDEIPHDGKVVLYCEKGIRSGLAIQRLEGLGYTNLYNLEGGMSNWKRTQ